MSSSKPLITIVGSLNIDFVTTTPRCPASGETLTATSLSILAGGKGANQAVGCGKASFVSPGVQDVDVHMVGAVGKDDVYVEKLLLPTLKDSGVNTDGVRECDDAQTGTASITVESSTGENRIMVVPGSNHRGMTNLPEVLSRATQDGRDPDIVVMQGEIPRATVLGLLEHFNGQDRKTQVVFNPAPVFPEGIPREAFKGLGVLVVNETETILLAKSFQAAGFDTTGVDKEEDLQNEAVVARLAEQFHDFLGIETVLITLGARGSFWSSNEGAEHGLVPGVRVPQVVDTTAAGDTFVGYFATALARHTATGQQRAFNVKEAVDQANRAAAKCVQREGAMQSIPYGYE